MYITVLDVYHSDYTEYNIYSELLVNKFVTEPATIILEHRVRSFMYVKPGDATQIYLEAYDSAIHDNLLYFH